MTEQNYRIDGGLIDRDRPLSFSFNNKTMQGYEGDTLASALLANGVRLVGRSFKYHRPRGIFSAGGEEPNALVHIGRNAFGTPNTRATTAELYEGLFARSQNHRGPLAFDVMAINDFLSPFLSAGFYYKTFMWPAVFWEKVYEPIIRASAGLGRLSGAADPDCYDKGFLHCDVLIIGGGVAGISAALAAGAAGAQVILADDDFALGGAMMGADDLINAKPAQDWLAEATGKLSAMNNVRVMTRTCVFGAFDHGIYGAVENKTDHLPPSLLVSNKPRQILWRIYTRAVILASGATERSIAFANNDRPGVMLGGAVRNYAERFGVATGRAISFFTNNDSAWHTANILKQKGVEIAAMIDVRDIAPPLSLSNTAIIMGAQVKTTQGRGAVSSITLTNNQTIKTDCLAVSGGFNPNVHLTCHHRGRPVWDAGLCAFVADGMPKGMCVVGAATGVMNLHNTLKTGHQTGKSVAKDLGFAKKTPPAPTANDKGQIFAISEFWQVKDKKPNTRAWVDLQNDVTVKDIEQAQAEGFESVEHLKRYTTLGMATDQGKTANVLGLAVLAQATGRPIAEVGTTVFRPPYSPVSLGAFGARSTGQDYMAKRLTPSHGWAVEKNAVFVEVGQWLRAQWYPKKGEATWRESVDREVIATRKSVGICDVSTLGKIDIQGRDAARFLNFVYANGFAKLAVGRVRYGLMLREDGICYDDGTTARLGENHFVMTTTTVNAGLVYRQLEFARQCLCPDFDVHLISITDAWAQFAIAGPRSRDLVAELVADLDLSNAAFPFMACANVQVGGVEARLFRISFSGELAYELAVPAQFGGAFIRDIMKRGKKYKITPYGVEALNVMRIEKGHFTGAELTGQTTALNLNLARMVSVKKDSVGAVLSRREAMMAEGSLRLCGVRPVDPEHQLRAGAHFIETGSVPSLDGDLGWVTSVCWSPSFGRYIALGFIKDGDKRGGDILHAWDGLHGSSCDVEIVSPHFYDPEGTIQNG